MTAELQAAFDQVQHRHDWLMSVMVGVAFFDLLKFVALGVVIYHVLRTSNDVRVVMLVATSHEQGTAQKIDDMHRVLVSESDMVKQRVSGLDERLKLLEKSALAAVCKIEQKVEEHVEAVRPLLGDGGKAEPAGGRPPAGPT